MVPDLELREHVCYPRRGRASSLLPCPTGPPPSEADLRHCPQGRGGVPSATLPSGPGGCPICGTALRAREVSHLQHCPQGWGGVPGPWEGPPPCLRCQHCLPASPLPGLVLLATTSRLLRAARSTALISPHPHHHLPSRRTSPGSPLRCSSAPCWPPGQCPRQPRRIFTGVVAAAKHSWKQFQSLEAK